MIDPLIENCNLSTDQWVEGEPITFEDIRESDTTHPEEILPQPLPGEFRQPIESAVTYEEVYDITQDFTYDSETDDSSSDTPEVKPGIEEISETIRGSIRKINLYLEDAREKPALFELLIKEAAIMAISKELQWDPARSLESDTLNEDVFNTLVNLTTNLIQDLCTNTEYNPTNVDFKKPYNPRELQSLAKSIRNEIRNVTSAFQQSFQDSGRYLQIPVLLEQVLFYNGEPATDEAIDNITCTLMEIDRTLSEIKYGPATVIYLDDPIEELVSSSGDFSVENLTYDKQCAYTLYSSLNAIKSIKNGASPLNISSVLKAAIFQAADSYSDDKDTRTETTQLLIEEILERMLIYLPSASPAAEQYELMRDEYGNPNFEKVVDDLGAEIAAIISTFDAIQKYGQELTSIQDVLELVLSKEVRNKSKGFDNEVYYINELVISLIKALTGKDRGGLE